MFGWCRYRVGFRRKRLWKIVSPEFNLCTSCSRCAMESTVELSSYLLIPAFDLSSPSIFLLRMLYVCTNYVEPSLILFWVEFQGIIGWIQRGFCLGCIFLIGCFGLSTFPFGQTVILKTSQFPKQVVVFGKRRNRLWKKIASDVRMADGFDRSFVRSIARETERRCGQGLVSKLDWSARDKNCIRNE